jgi:hypothetical protein
MLRTVRQGPVYPDANGTLRFSYATVGGYSPREGLTAAPQTTLTGQLAKLTGSAPFTLPQRMLDLPRRPRALLGRPGLGDLPINFLANGDTTGGNSGSPVINGRGELVGLNFDRVWENIAGDFGYNPARSRNVIVDVRYLLWLLDRVEDAGALLDRARRRRPARRRPRPAEPVPGDSPVAAAARPGPRARGAGRRLPRAPRLRLRGRRGGGLAALLVLALLAPRTEAPHDRARGAVETYLHWLQWRLGHALVDDLMTPDQAVAWHELCRELRLGPAPLARTRRRPSWRGPARARRMARRTCPRGQPADCGWSARRARACARCCTTSCSACAVRGPRSRVRSRSRC